MYLLTVLEMELKPLPRLDLISPQCTLQRVHSFISSFNVLISVPVRTPAHTMCAVALRGPRVSDSLELQTAVSQYLIWVLGPQVFYKSSECLPLCHHSSPTG